VGTGGAAVADAIAIVEVGGAVAAVAIVEMGGGTALAELCAPVAGAGVSCPESET
jgi:hypothetical protein